MAHKLEYEILVGNTVQEIHDQMKEAIAKGWKPQGGISVAVWYEPEDVYHNTPDTHTEYAQAIVRENPPVFAPGQDSAESAIKPIDSAQLEGVRTIIGG